MSVIVRVGFEGVSISTSLRLSVSAIASISARVLPAANGPRHKSQRLYHLVDQVLGTPVKRLRVYQRAALFEKPDQNREDRRHARIEHSGCGRAALQRNELVFKNLGIRVIEACID